ncbi:putative efflux protein, MATE family [Alkalithermobacter thermoalcaliphilus JW-YL-7 = DSM 7308]|uniref:Multidrug export protein MepA n=1 Tax=Alkalithermobacter thermoalcaliphilus JW-YL-7 = DSM 7308 TaxID=1121328 RepID=A0A150FQ26_CLOPD|nr:MATE efflux family protein [[Clostridium] paradoxum JW-YL-7 = DSM 7308]SHK91675.1 putative efflux protein, MATE family [[Clostridium] paradoxum JW-YL-7 = DSM 7308]
MEHSKQLGEEKIGKLLLKFSIPAIVGMIVNSIYNVVDRIFIGRGVGSLALTSITISFPIMLIIMAFGMLIGIGATSLISIRLGEQKYDQAQIILGNAFSLLVVTSITISVLGLIFVNPILTRFGASSAVLPYAREYLGIILMGSIFQSIGFGMNGFIRAEGNPKIAMYTMIIGAVANVALDPLFIFTFNMGIKGAAIATVISQAISSSWVLYYFIGGKSSLKIYTKNLKLDMRIVKEIIAIGLAPFSMQIAASVIVVILNRYLYTYGGDSAVAAMGIINSISMFILMPIFGINQGSQPIIGYNYGAKEYDRVKETLKYAILVSTIICIAGFIVIMKYPENLIMIFNNEDKDLIRIGAYGMKVVMCMLPIVGFQIVGSNYFQAVGKAKYSMFLSLSRQVLFLIPVLIIMPKFLGLEGVWLASPISDFLSFILTFIVLFIEMKKLDEEKIQNNDIINES